MTTKLSQEKHPIAPSEYSPTVNRILAEYREDHKPRYRLLFVRVGLPIILAAIIIYFFQYVLK